MRATCVHRGGGGQKWPKNCVRTNSMLPNVRAHLQVDRVLQIVVWRLSEYNM